MPSVWRRSRLTSSSCHPVFSLQRCARVSTTTGCGGSLTGPWNSSVRAWSFPMSSSALARPMRRWRPADQPAHLSRGDSGAAAAQPCCGDRPDGPLAQRLRARPATATPSPARPTAPPTSSSRGPRLLGQHRRLTEKLDRRRRSLCVLRGGAHRARRQPRQPSNRWEFDEQVRFKNADFRLNDRNRRPEKPLRKWR